MSELDPEEKDVVMDEAWAGQLRGYSPAERQLLRVMTGALRGRQLEAADVWIDLSESQIAQHFAGGPVGAALRAAVEALAERRIRWNTTTCSEEWIALLNRWEFDPRQRQWELRLPREVAESLRSAVVQEALSEATEPATRLRLV